MIYKGGLRYNVHTARCAVLVNIAEIMPNTLSGEGGERILACFFQGKLHDCMLQWHG
jgi:hypothetical protein